MKSLSGFSIFILFVLAIQSCGKSEEEQIISAKREALFFLTSGNCQAAQDTLEDISPSSSDQEYVSLYASVFSCYANFREIETVVDNLSTLNADATNLFKSLAAFESAQEVTAPDSFSYTNILRAIKVISDSSSINGAQGRVSHFGEKPGADLNYQILLLTTVALSKFLGAYGNVDSTGAKGLGSGSSTVCLAQYNYNNVNTTYLDSIGGDGCDSGTTSNSNTAINTIDPDYTRRICEGVVLYNNFLDLLVNLVLPTDTTDLGNLPGVAAVLNSFTLAAQLALTPLGDSAAVTTYENVRDIATCQSTASLNITNANHLEAYFSLFLEGNHRR